MTPLSAYSPLNSGRGRRRTAAVALCAAALAALAGCSTSSGSSSVPLGTTGPTGRTGTTGTTGTTGHLAPMRAIRLAAAESRRVTSMTATFSEQVGKPVIATATANAQLQLKPTLLIEENVHSTTGGHSVVADEIVTARAIYLKAPNISAGKPWAEVPFSELGHSMGSTISNLLENAQNANPATQTEVLTASKNVHVVGTEVVNGVETTHYRGMLPAATALARLMPSMRKGLAPLLRLITGDIRFDIWLDSQHVTRRLIEKETVISEPVTVILNVTSVNQPVQITLPPASQVAIVPKSKLGSL